MAGDAPRDAGYLDHRYRRQLLYCLYPYATPITLPDVADQLTVWDPDADGEYLRERLRVYDALYYDHLPALREAGVDDYSQREDMVEWGPEAEAVKPDVERLLLAEFPDLLDAEREAFDGGET